MKIKKIIAIMLIATTACAIGAIGINAGDLWEGTTYYSIEGIDFVYYYYEYDLEQYFGKYQKHSAYIRGDEYFMGNIQENIYYIIYSLYLEDKNAWEYDAFAIKTLMEPAYTEGNDVALLYEHNVFIDEGLYNMLKSYEGTIPFEGTETIGGIEAYFNSALLSAHSTINNINNLWLDDKGELTIISWLIIAGIGIIATVNIIKLIKIKRKE